MMFCRESRQTLDNCIRVWGPEVKHFCPGIPIILVGVLHCYRPDYDDDKYSVISVTDESANTAAKNIGKKCQIVTVIFKHFHNVLCMLHSGMCHYVVTGAYTYYECDLYKRYEVYGALLLGVTAVLRKSGYQEHGGKLHKYLVCVRVCVHVHSCIFKLIGHLFSC